jgi:Sec-independent protein secretion pathway component TatC
VLRGAQMEAMKVKLSTLWIFGMFNMVFADIVGFMNPGALENIMKGTVGLEITQELLLVFSIVLEIPIAMIFLSRVLKYGANRWANIIAGVIMILFVIGGGSIYLSYIFFATVEVICISLIIWYAWKWPNSEVLAQSQFGESS